MFLFIVMHTAFLTRSENGKFSCKLPNRISNISQVALVEFAYDTKKLAHRDLSALDRSFRFEYDADLDDTTTYGSGNLTIPGLNAQNGKYLQDIDPQNGKFKDFIYAPNPIFYSSLVYKFGTQPLPKPTIEATMYQSNGNPQTDFEIVDFSSIFDSELILKFDFRKIVKYKK